MNTARTCLLIAGSLDGLIGVACILGGIALWRGGAKDWPDVTAGPAAIERVAFGLWFAGGLLLASSAALFLRWPWAAHTAAVALALFVAGGFWGNYAVFGDIRPMHTGTNVVIAAIVLGLLWAGYPALGNR